MVPARGDARDAGQKPGASHPLDLNRNVAIRRRVVPELTVDVQTPAVHPARRAHRAGVVHAGGDGRDAGQKPGPPDPHDLNRNVAIRRRVVPERTVDVPAPAVHRARRAQRAGVVHARGDRRRLRHRSDRVGVDRNRAAVGHDGLEVERAAAGIESERLGAARTRERGIVAN